MRNRLFPEKRYVDGQDENRRGVLENFGNSGTDGRKHSRMKMWILENPDIHPFRIRSNLGTRSDDNKNRIHARFGKGAYSPFQKRFISYRKKCLAFFHP